MQRDNMRNDVDRGRSPVVRPCVVKQRMASREFSTVFTNGVTRARVPCRLLRVAEKEQTHRIEDAKRGQYLGWSLSAGAVIAAAVVSLCHGPWQVSVALVGIPVLGAVQALRAIRWL
jgi:hypothetical protein